MIGLPHRKGDTRLSSDGSLCFEGFTGQEVPALVDAIIEVLALGERWNWVKYDVENHSQQKGNHQ